MGVANNLVNNLPVDVVRTMGADIVIAVDISRAGASGNRANAPADAPNAARAAALPGRGVEDGWTDAWSVENDTRGQTAWIVGDRTAVKAMEAGPSHGSIRQEWYS